jgi:hypothetical protein
MPEPMLQGIQLNIRADQYIAIRISDRPRDHAVRRHPYSHPGNDPTSRKCDNRPAEMRDIIAASRCVDTVGARIEVHQQEVTFRIGCRRRARIVACDMLRHDLHFAERQACDGIDHRARYCALLLRSRLLGEHQRKKQNRCHGTGRTPSLTV